MSIFSLFYFVTPTRIEQTKSCFFWQKLCFIFTDEVCKDVGVWTPILDPHILVRADFESRGFYYKIVRYSLQCGIIKPLLCCIKHEAVLTAVIAVKQWYPTSLYVYWFICKDEMIFSTGGHNCEP